LAGDHHSQPVEIMIEIKSACELRPASAPKKVVVFRQTIEPTFAPAAT
jgi:hypothetical protein